MARFKTVIVNARFLTQPLTGVQRYCMELSRRLKRLDPTIRFVTPRGVLHRELAEELGAEEFGWLPKQVWEQVELPIYLWGKEALLVNLIPTAPFLCRNKIVTIHDLAFMRDYSWFSWWYLAYMHLMTRGMLWGALGVATVSEFSRGEIAELLHLEAVVIGNAGPDRCEVGKRPPFDNYLLVVSPAGKRKNFERLLEAFLRVKEKGLKLVVVGAGVSSERVIYLGRVSDAELGSLYRYARGLVYPSLYEGFGIPPLEAMAYGCPVLVSRIPVLMEVCGGNALYCDPYDVKDMSCKIEQLLERGKGYENSGRFSWERSAEQLHALILRETK